jgi:transcription termination/antitermination protein NusG
VVTDTPILQERETLRSALDKGGAVQPGSLFLSWHVLYTKSRQEKALANDLTEMGVSHYLPLTNDLRYHGPRRTRVSVPLFPGYMFLQGTIEQLFSSLRTRRVVRVIEVSDQAQLDWELCNIRLALENHATLSRHRLVKGCPVEVRSGPLKGLQGVVESLSKMNRIILSVRMLGRAVGIEIDGQLLDVVSPE